MSVAAAAARPNREDDAPERIPAAARAHAPEEDSAKRRQILDGAREAFLAAGFDGASMNDVARAAGVSKGTLYVYFQSKEALFEALIRADKQTQAERMSALDEALPAREALTRLGVDMLTGLTRPQSIAQIRTVIGVTAKFPQIGRAFHEAGAQHSIARLAEWLERRAGAGEFVIEDARRAAAQFFDLCKSGPFARLLFGFAGSVDEEEIADTVARAVDLFLRAYGADRLRTDSRSAPG